MKKLEMVWQRLDASRVVIGQLHFHLLVSVWTFESKPTTSWSRVGNLEFFLEYDFTLLRRSLEPPKELLLYNQWDANRMINSGICSYFNQLLVHHGPPIQQSRKSQERHWNFQSQCPLSQNSQTKKSNKLKPVNWNLTSDVFIFDKMILTSLVIVLVAKLVLLYALVWIDKELIILKIVVWG